MGTWPTHVRKQKALRKFAHYHCVQFSDIMAVTQNHGNGSKSRYSRRPWICDFLAAL